MKSTWTIGAQFPIELSLKGDINCLVLIGQIIFVHTITNGSVESKLKVSSRNVEKDKSIISLCFQMKKQVNFNYLFVLEL